MFEVIVGAVCLGVVAVEIIEVRQKCEESSSGMWHDGRAFQLEILVREDKCGAEQSPPRFHPDSPSLTGLLGETGRNGRCA